MKRMLFNATQQEELRVAIVDGQKLIDIDIETTGREQRKSNIYKGVITRIEPSLEACFVNYGEERHGFLPFKEVARSYFREGVDVRNATIKEALREGQEIVVQVEKEERGNKGAALTSFISLAGRYLVLMPNNPRGGGVSRRVEGEDRQELRETMDKLDLPAGMSVIARTAGIGRGVDELQWDLNYLMQLWRAIEGAGQSASGAFLIYQESSLVIRAIRDYFQPDIGEILIDTDDIYEQAQQFMTHVMPDMVHRVKRYRDDVPLFSRFQIEHQIESAYSRTVPLPSGGAIVIDHTEALVSIDVNSARATRGSDIETTALNTNLEAADEVARQLRLRDLGGLIVIDFIDMENAKNQREVETRLKDALRYDRARVQMGKISRFGLMELSRQRLRPSLSEGSHVTCPRCNGTGHIRDTESSALQVLRIVQEEAMKENSAAIHVQAPVDVAAFLLNEKRGEILKIESRHRVVVVLIPNKHLETPHYKLERIKHDDPRLEDTTASYELVEEADTDISYGKRQKEEVKPRQEAVVKGITPDQPAPIVERKPVTPPPAPVAPEPETAEQGFFSRMFGFFRKKPVVQAAAPAPVVEEKPAAARERTDRNGRGPRNRNRNNRRDREEVKPDAVAEPAKQALPVAGEAQASTRPPREPRPPRQPRAPRENAEARNTEPRNESRRERQTGERPAGEAVAERPRRQREERKEAASDEQLFDAVNGVTPGAVEPAAAVQPAHLQANANLESAADGQFEAGFGDEENGGDEPRRRRRRGGRNRNRRDRENGEMLAGGEAGGNGAEAAPASVGEFVVSHVEVVSVTTEQVYVQTQPDAGVPEAPAHAAATGEAPAATSTEAASAEAAAIETPAVETTQPADTAAAFAAPAAEPATAAPAPGIANAEAVPADLPPAPEVPVVQPASAEPAPAYTAPASTSSETAASEAAVAALEPVVAAAPAPVAVPADAATAAAPADGAPAPEVTTPAVATPAVATADVATAAPSSAEPTQPVEKAAPAAPSSQKPAFQADSLREMLSAAGLTLAVTDPEKLRIAQEEAARYVPAPRVPRERKPLPPQPTEPLVQVETRRQA